MKAVEAYEKCLEMARKKFSIEVSPTEREMGPSSREIDPNSFKVSPLDKEISGLKKRETRAQKEKDRRILEDFFRQITSPPSGPGE